MQIALLDFQLAPDLLTGTVRFERFDCPLLNIFGNEVANKMFPIAFAVMRNRRTRDPDDQSTEFA